MIEYALVFFKQVVHWNVNLAVLVLLAWGFLGRGRAARTTLAVWSILLIRALAEPWLCPQLATPPDLNFAQEGMLSVGLGMGWGERTISVLLGLGTEQIGVGDLAVLSFGEGTAVALGGLFLAVICLSFVIRFFALWRVRGTETDVIWSSSASSPHIRGWWRPSIIVPDELSLHLSEAELDAIMCHERAHLKRGDHRWFALLFLLRAFCPVLWPMKIILDSVEQAIERLCDRVAANEVGALETARALVKVAEFQAHRGLLTPVTACPLFSRHPITERVAALARVGKERESILTLLASLFFLAAVIL